MARETIIGDYGKVAKVSDTVIDTGTLETGVKYAVKTLGTSTALPAGLAVGYVFTSDGTEDITSSGDEVLKLDETDACDITGFSLENSKSEIAATTLCDTNTVYLAGKNDISGSIEGIYKIGVTDIAGGWANTFVDVVEQAGDGGAVTISAANGDQVYLILYLQKSQESGETETFYVVPVTKLTFSTSIAEGSTSAFSTSIRIAPDADIKYQLVKNTKA